jgi:tetratricopeptide repeat protein
VRPPPPRAGRLEEVEHETRIGIATYTRTSGPEHPHTLAIRVNHGVILRRLGRLEESEGRLSAVLEDCERALGTSHEMTDASRRTLAAVRQELYD